MEMSPEVLHPKRKRRTALLASAALFTAAATGTVTVESQRTSCSDDVAPLGDYTYETVLPDITQGQLLNSEKRTEYLEAIETTYGIDVTFADTITSKNAEDLTNALNGTVDAFEDFSPTLTHNLTLDSFTIAETVTYQDETVGGLYSPDTHTIQVAAASTAAVQANTAHELWHAVDFQLLCPSSDVDVDHAVAQHTTVDVELGENGEPDENLEPEYYEAHPHRQFAETYGTKNVREDRATQIEALFYKRGIILEGDPDFNSPYQLKQAETLRRLEMLLPGITQHLEEKTALLRPAAAELLNSIEHPYEPGHLSRVDAILANAYRTHQPVDQLRNTTITIAPPNQAIVTVQDPVIVRDIHGDIKGFSWTNLDRSDGATSTIYYDPTFIDIHYTPESYTFTGLIETTNPNGVGYILTAVKIGDTVAQEIPTLP